MFVSKDVINIYKNIEKYGYIRLIGRVEEILTC